jgi:branched-subunit amino acid aminotransferase/4-amino-4-deoxychorismate lyase
VIAGWLDGRWLSPDEPALPLSDQGFLLGMGLAETLRIASGRPVLATEHLARMTASARALRLPEPALLAQLPGVSADLAARAGLRDGVVRWTWTAGAGGRPALAATLRPLPPDLAARRRGTHGVTVALERALAAHKITSRADLVWAQQLATEGAPAPAEAILTGTDGQVLEGAWSALFIATGRGVTAPPTDGRRLSSVTLAWLLGELATAGVSVERAPLWRADLLRAEAVFVTNAVVGVARLASLDGEALGSGELPGAGVEWPEWAGVERAP